MKFRAIFSSVALLALAGCSSLYAGAQSGATSGASGTPSVATSYPIIGYSTTPGGPVLSGGLTSSDPTPGSTVTPTPLTPDASGNLSVTLADNGRMVVMHVGQRFLLNLGDTYNWTFSIDDQSIVSRVPNILTIRGSQGLFEAHAAGSTVLHATGDPQCRQSQPACGMPSILFQIQITVLD